jgi:hypothetical protein
VERGQGATDVAGLCQMQRDGGRGEGEGGGQGATAGAETGQRQMMGGGRVCIDACARAHAHARDYSTPAASATTSVAATLPETSAFAAVVAARAACWRFVNCVWRARAQMQKVD